MTVVSIDYQAVFRESPAATTLLSTDLEIVDANDDFLAAVGRAREDVLGRDIFTAFPRNPREPEQTSEYLRASLENVLATGERDTMQVTRYDIEVAAKPGVYEERYWAVVNTPVHAPNGQIELIENRVEDVTSTVREVQKAQAVSG
jgi:PAS domain S-box-containing protein